MDGMGRNKKGKWIDDSDGTGVVVQAFAQQLKNKDIPEGGSKAVVLMEPHSTDLLDPDMFGRNFMVILTCAPYLLIIGNNR